MPLDLAASKACAMAFRSGPIGEPSTAARGIRVAQRDPAAAACG
jgi:hypothetical protein